MSDDTIRQRKRNRLRTPLALNTYKLNLFWVTTSWKPCQGLATMINMEHKQDNYWGGLTIKQTTERATKHGTVRPRGLQRDVVYLGWPIAFSYMSPNAGGWGELRGLSKWVYNWARILKLLKSPRIDSERPFSPGVQPCGPARQPYYYSVLDCLKIPALYTQEPNL